MSKLYPIAEEFISPQGEGLFSGTLMHFIRLAGCCVGKPFPKERYEKLPHCEFKCPGGDPDLGHSPDCEYAKAHKNLLPIYTEQCTTYDGRKFECDTDYRVKERLTDDELLHRVREGGADRVCLTGGEPFIHDLGPLVSTLTVIDRPGVAGRRIHVETSGTRSLDSAFPGLGLADGVRHWLVDDLWITVSPKEGVLPEMLQRANEVKLLVDTYFKEEKALELLEHCGEKTLIYIQPINDENAVDFYNLGLCLALQKKHPTWRLSSQLHKIWKCR